MHFGEITYGVDERGEVANLTRNVVFQTEAQLAQTNSSAQTFLDKVTRQLKVKRLHFLISRSGKAYVDGISIEQGGQEGQLGKYPFHWHHAGDVSGQYVKNSVFSNSLNKCISVHVTDRALIENNVGYNSAGHCFYLEHDETSEVRSKENMFKNNLSLETNIPHSSQRVKDYDDLAAGFWVTHPRNFFVGNVAGGAGALNGQHPGAVQRGGTGNGFWFEIMQENYAEAEGIALFDDNRAHSNSSAAFWINEPGRYNMDKKVEVNDFVGYKNRLSNMWVRMVSTTAQEDFVINNSQFADSLSGVYYASTGRTPYYSNGVVNNSLFVAETDNKGTVVEGYDEIVGVDGRTVPLNLEGIVNRGGTTVRAIEVYDGDSEYHGNTFVNYQPNEQRESGVFALPYDTPWTMIPNVIVTDSTLVDSQPFQFDPSFLNYGARNIHIHDVDGTLTGTEDSFNSGIFSLLRTDECAKPLPRSNWYQCVDGNYTMLHLSTRDNHVYETAGYNFARRSDGAEGEIAKVTESPNKDLYHGNFKMGEWYDHTGYAVRESEEEGKHLYNLNFRFRHTLEGGDWIGLSYEYPEYPDIVELEGDTPEELQEVFSKEAVEAATESSYFYSYDEQRLYVKFWVKDETRDVFTYPQGFWMSNIALKIGLTPTIHTEETATLTAASLYPQGDNTRFVACGVDASNSGNFRVDPNNNRQLLYTPNTNYTGLASLYYDVCYPNGRLREESRLTRVRVIPNNTRPEAERTEVEVSSNSENNAFSITVNDEDNNYDLENESRLELKQQPTNGTINTQDLRNLTYTPDPDYIGQDTAVFLACDDSGECDLATVVFDVGNTKPTAIDDTAEGDENETLTLNPLANDTDPDPTDELSICSENGITQPAVGRVTLQDGALLYTPPTGYFGETSFTYRVCDRVGASDEGQVTLVIRETDGIPYANTDRVTLNEDTFVDINPLTNDYSVSDYNFCVPDAWGQPKNGVTAPAPTGIRYTPKENFAGSDSFTYNICDAEGDRSTGTVELTVQSVNDAPIANPDTVSIKANEVGIITPTLNDTDVEGAVLLICHENGITQPSRGSAYRESETLISYQPGENATYTDTFTYQLCEEDGQLETTGTITVEVSKYTLPPVATDDKLTFETQPQITLDLLTNDSDADSDFALCAENGFSQPSQGTLVLEADRLLYRPPVNYVGEVSFSYRLCDPDGNTDEGQVRLTLVENTNGLIPVVQDKLIQAYPTQEVGFGPLRDLSQDDNVETLTYEVSALDEKLNCTVPNPLVSESTITCDLPTDLPASVYSFTVTPTDENDQTGAGATFSVDVQTLLNPTVNLEIQIPNPEADYTGQEVEVKAVVKNLNPIDIKDVQTRILINANFARFRDNGNVQSMGSMDMSQANWLALPVHASPSGEEDIIYQEFTTDSLAASQSITFSTVIIPKQNSLGLIRADTAIKGLGIDRSQDYIEEDGREPQVVDSGENTVDTSQDSTPTGVTTTPRTGGSSRVWIALGVAILTLIVLGASTLQKTKPAE